MLHKKFFLIPLLVILTFLAFSPVLNAQFLNWDDDVHLTNNINVLTFDLPHIRALFRQHVNDIYVPLTTFSFAIEHCFFGFNPFVYHLDNVLLHIAVAILVFFFAINLRLSFSQAFLGALIFAVHPMKVESVAWITERKDVLYALFYMASLVSYQKGRGGYSFVFCILSMLAKPMALSLPLIIILLDWFNGKGINRRTIVSKWPYFLVAVVISWLSYQWNARVPLINMAHTPLIWAWTFIFYIKKFLMPFNLVPIYVLPKPIGLFYFSYWSSLLLFVSLVIGLWWGRRYKFLTFAFAFYVLSIFFILRLDAAVDTNMVADRFAYLPTLGFCLLAAVVISRVYQGLNTRALILRHLFSGAVIALTLGLIFFSIKQSFIWHDSISLWRYQLSIAPHPLAFNNLVVILKGSIEYQQAQDRYRSYLMDQEAHKNNRTLDGNDLKKVEELIDLYKKSISVDSQFVSAYVNLAKLYENLYRREDALVWFHKALLVDVKNKNAFLGLGQLYLKMNQYQLAIETFNHLLKVHPDAVAYFNLGFAYEQQGDHKKAIYFYKKTLELNPTYEKALFNLANLYQRMGELKTALIWYQELLHRYPRSMAAYINMGTIYGHLGDRGYARILYQKATQIAPNDARIYFNLGVLSESAGDLKEAVDYYKKAVEKNPKFDEAYYNMGKIYVALGQEALKSKDYVGAIHYLEEAKVIGYTPPMDYLKSLEAYRKKF